MSVCVQQYSRGVLFPKPHVETIQNVVSFKLAINPDGAINNRYPSSSLIRAAQNIKDTHYFIFYRDFDGTPVFRDKVDVDQKQWSLPMVPWKNGKSGLQPEQLRQKPTRPPHEPDLVKMSNTVTESLFRCNEHQKACVTEDLERLEAVHNAGTAIHWSVHFFAVAVCCHVIIADCGIVGLDKDDFSLSCVMKGGRTRSSA